jgi:hypothetical protein
MASGIAELLVVEGWRWVGKTELLTHVAVKPADIYR